MRQPHWGFACFPHSRRAQPDFHGDCEATTRAIGGMVEIGQRQRVPFGARGQWLPEWLQRLQRHHPRADAAGEILGKERPEWLILPTLNVTRRPIVQNTDTEQMVIGLCQRNGVAHGVAGSYERAEFELVVQQSRGSDGWRGVVRCHALAAGSTHRRARYHNGGGASVVSDRHPLVIRQQRIVRPEHRPHVGGVVYRGVEVGVVTDFGRQEQLGILLRDQRIFSRLSPMHR